MVAISAVLSGIKAFSAIVKAKWLSWRDYIIIILLAIAAGASWFAYSSYNKNLSLDARLANEISNRMQYQAIANGIENDNRVLRLNIGDLSHSNDSLIQSLNETRKSLRIKENALKQALSVNTVIRDTIMVTLPDSLKTSVDFTTKLEPNELTTFTISRRGEEITCIPEIYNKQELFIHSRKEYRNKKNFFQRLFTWDWKKDKVSRYNIVNSNDLIKITDTRIIEIETE